MNKTRQELYEEYYKLTDAYKKSWRRIDKITYDIYYRLTKVFEELFGTDYTHKN